MKRAEGVFSRRRAATARPPAAFDSACGFEYDKEVVLTWSGTDDNDIVDVSSICHSAHNKVPRNEEKVMNRKWRFVHNIAGSLHCSI